MSNISSIDSSASISPYTSGGRLDAYAIFQLNFEALGGEKYVKSEKNFRYQGDMQLGSATFQIEEFISKPLRNVTSIYSNFQIVYRSGDDGRNIWTEQNGNVYKFDDSNTNERELRKLWEEYAYTDPKNRTFKSNATKKVSIDGVNCYEVVIKNNKTNEIVTHYYDTETFLLKREIKDTGTQKIQHDFSDYQNVGNIKLAFQKDITFLNSGAKQSITWNNIQKGIYISDSRFIAPEDPRAEEESSNTTGLGTRLDRYA
ncbi:MAG: hypothetical protein FWG98_14375 [Candidatus Cloacimonetes bacterium]|nr:hypothetical protein [Candidatus Cloacimonadota bacterium]